MINDSIPWKEELLRTAERLGGASASDVGPNARPFWSRGTCLDAIAGKVSAARALWLGSGCRFDSDGAAVALLLITAPLLLKLVTGVKNRHFRAARTTKGMMRMTNVWLRKTMHSVGCGLAGGILSQTRAHGAVDFPMDTLR